MQMAKFRYAARGEKLGLVRGYLEAPGEFEAAEELNRRGLAAVSLRRCRGIFEPRGPAFVGDRVLAAVAGGFPILLGAGLTLPEATELMAGESVSGRLGGVLAGCAGDMAAGETLSGSLRRRCRAMPEVFIETLSAGEESGTVAEAFSALKEHHQRRYRTMRRVRAALWYPALIAVLAFAVVGIVLAVLGPTMEELYRGMGEELPWATLALMGVSRAIKGSLPEMAAGLILAILGFAAAERCGRSRRYLSALRLRLPAVGRIARYQAAAMTANTISVMMAAGAPLDRCLAVAGRAVGARCVGDELTESAGLLTAGGSLGEALGRSRYLPPALGELAALGEKTGTLSDTLRAAGDYYSSEAASSAQDALTMLEPVITVAMGLLVAFILVAIYVPMFYMYRGIGA